MSRIAYVNGQYRDLRDASVNIEDRGYQFADGVYEVCEVRGGKLVDFPRHMARLERSLRELRIAMPMLAPDGQPLGIVVATADMRPALERVRSSPRRGEMVYVVDARGNYLIHPDRTREFGSQRAVPADWRKDFPTLAGAIGTTKHLTQAVRTGASGHDGMALVPVLLAGSEVAVTGRPDGRTAPGLRWATRPAARIGSLRGGTMSAGPTAPNVPGTASELLTADPVPLDSPGDSCARRVSHDHYLSAADLASLDAWWRAANYLSVAQIYLLDNPLLRRPLSREDVKRRLLGHWGTTPGLNFLYAHFNRAIVERDLNAIYIAGPGHGGPGLVANAYLDHTYTEVYPAISRDEGGLGRLCKQFSFPGGIPSHVAPETPGSIHEGGELGYALSHAYGAAFDNKDLLVFAVVGDGEAETGPLATSWHSNKFVNPATDGVVLPILHLNGYKIANPTVLARIPEEELAELTDLHRTYISLLERGLNSPSLRTLVGLSRALGVTLTEMVAAFEQGLAALPLGDGEAGVAPRQALPGRPGDDGHTVWVMEGDGGLDGGLCRQSHDDGRRGDHLLYMGVFVGDRLFPRLVRGLVGAVRRPSRGLLHHTALGQVAPQMPHVGADPQGGVAWVQAFRGIIPDNRAQSLPHSCSPPESASVLRIDTAKRL
mgnify:CR=1 FL=1